MADPQTVEEWLALAAQHEASARGLATTRLTAAQAIWHCGLATECALKAYIQHQARFNAWPSRGARPDLYTHDLRSLAAIAHIDPLRPSALRPSWHTLFQWHRNQGYDPKPTPIPVAKGYVEAAFGKDGAVTWLRAQLP